MHRGCNHRRFQLVSFPHNSSVSGRTCHYIPAIVGRGTLLPSIDASGGCHYFMAYYEYMKNFHLPLPEQTYALLREEAERTQLPATTLAREAIDAWLRDQA